MDNLDEFQRQPDLIAFIVASLAVISVSVSFTELLISGDARYIISVIFFAVPMIGVGIYNLINFFL